MRILVAIASYGTKNDHFMNAVIEEYRKFPHEVHIIVLTNQEKPVPPGVELKVGLPAKNPWSLPFAHKPIFAERKNDFDLYIYSEDDTPITMRHIDTFLKYTAVLPENQIAGFLRYEAGPDGTKYISSAHAQFHWLVDSIKDTAAGRVAQFTNEHSAAYIITRQQLHRMLDSGGFMAPVREGRYDMLCTAATDVYTQCGFSKVVGIAEFDDFLLHHMPNKYVGRMGVTLESFRRMIDVLHKMAAGKHPRCNLLPVPWVGDFDRWLPSYYEDVNPRIMEAVPADAKRVLVIGCGSGKTEEALMKRGHQVQALPLDSLIGALAADRGVDVRYVPISRNWDEDVSDPFDCIVVNGILHLVEEPLDLLKRCVKRLGPKGALVVRSPNFGFLSYRWYCFKRMPGFSRFEPFSATGVKPHCLSRLKGWMHQCGLTLDHENLRRGEIKRLSPRVQSWLPQSVLSVEAIYRGRRG